MLDLAMFALGVIGLKARRPRATRESLEASFRIDEMRKEEETKEKHNILVSGSKKRQIEFLENNFYKARTNLGESVHITSALFRYDDIMWYQGSTTLKTYVPFEDLANIPVDMAKSVDMTVPEFIIWMVNISQRYTDKGIITNLYCKDGKYYTHEFVSYPRSGRFFDGARAIFIPCLLTETEKKLAQRKNLRDEENDSVKIVLKTPYKILECDDLEKFIAERPADLLTNLFGNENWKWYVDGYRERRMNETKPD